MFFKKTLNFVDIYRELSQVINTHFHKEDNDPERESNKSKPASSNKNYHIKMKTGFNHMMKCGYSFTKNSNEFRIKNHKSLSGERGIFHKNMWKRMEYNLSKNACSISQTEKSLNEIKVFKKFI